MAHPRRTADLEGTPRRHLGPARRPRQPTAARGQPELPRVLRPWVPVRAARPHAADEPVGGVRGLRTLRLSHLMHRLETRGLVRRHPTRRTDAFTLAVLTPAGHELAIKAAPIHVEHVRRLIFDVLDETEQRALRGALTKILSKLMGGRAGPKSPEPFLLVRVSSWGLRLVQEASSEWIPVIIDLLQPELVRQTVSRAVTTTGSDSDGQTGKRVDRRSDQGM